MNSPSSAVADALAWAATILAVVAAAVGLFVTGLYRDVPFWAEQAPGIDLATLLLAVGAIQGPRPPNRTTGAVRPGRAA